MVVQNKVNDSRKVIRNIARLVGKGFNQIKGIDFEETFTSMVKFTSLFML